MCLFNLYFTIAKLTLFNRYRFHGHSIANWLCSTTGIIHTPQGSHGNDSQPVTFYSDVDGAIDTIGIIFCPACDFSSLFTSTWLDYYYRHRVRLFSITCHSYPNCYVPNPMQSGSGARVIRPELGRFWVSQYVQILLSSKCVATFSLQRLGGLLLIVAQLQTYYFNILGLWIGCHQ
jgi:hypothetical protein